MSLWSELNWWPLPYQGSALPLSYKGLGAEDGSRTRYLQLGRLSLYQMSYFREWGEEDSNLRSRRQQIYSLPHLTALESPRFVVWFDIYLSRWADSNRRPADYKSAALASWATSALYKEHKKADLSKKVCKNIHYCWINKKKIPKSW